MFKPDVIVAWPRNCDYPLWREFIRTNRDRFNLVIIVFTETHYGEDYRQFIRDAMLRDYVLFIDNPQVGKDEDWRDLAMHQALIQSYNAQWLWFTEQDFIPLEGFWEDIERDYNYGDEVIAAYDDKRMHPCSIFIKRETLQTKTRKNFGIVKDVSDHFSLIQRDLEQNNAVIYKIPRELYEHLNGLSHNLTLIYNGSEPVWQPQRFTKYLLDSIKVAVPLDPRYIKLVEEYLKKHYPLINVKSV